MKMQSNKWLHELNGNTNERIFIYRERLKVFINIIRNKKILEKHFQKDVFDGFFFVFEEQGRNIG